MTTLYLRTLLSRPIETSLPDKTRNILIEALGPDVDRFRELTGKPFPNWPSFPALATERVGPAG